MAALVIRNIPEATHNALRRLASQWHMPVEALARKALADLAERNRPSGIDFGQLDRDRAALGLTEDGPEWTVALDDPALSRSVLGLD